MKALFRSNADTDRNQLQHRLIRQTASLLLTYPDDRLPDRLAGVRSLLDHVGGQPRRLLDSTVDALTGADPFTLQADYVDTFDLHRGATMYLTYWTDGDTRNRGTAMHAFAQTYRQAGAPAPATEAPDHLTVVLEFAATVDPAAGERLLREHRIALDILRGALNERASVYAPTVEAVCLTLPPVTDQDQRRAQRLAAAGPPAEAIGLQPFTLTVPPRRDGAGNPVQREGADDGRR
ncbi:nitrate reductase molybdenum cofactor assembly chaperone [Nocardia farcinica]|uniref:nitrate reductase molybdenum cofactor assembly chaperone n=1 Tax=Nocardia farcinica TaxID=37329 RepID=UPI0018948F82|nr:nitrate reductase molybdenum cofactor assembly chaperone [Nocardia farcinica]MBF6072889.1 nitrate reductase molybdenum cofactor assembly chaperone [Nocardia farcinica]